MLFESIYATKHSIDRSHERRGYSEKRAKKDIKLALERGKSAKDYSSDEKRFLESKSRDNEIAITYNGFCYIVSVTGACVTVFELPIWFDKKHRYNGKERIRNAKSYYRNYSFCDLTA